MSDTTPTLTGTSQTQPHEVRGNNCVPISSASTAKARLNAVEQRMLAELLASRRKNIPQTTASDVIRQCIRDAYNKLRRSNRKPQIVAIPGDTGGELRRGRPPHKSEPGAYHYSVEVVSAALTSTHSNKQETA